MPELTLYRIGRNVYTCARNGYRYETRKLPALADGTPGGYYASVIRIGDGRVAVDTTLRSLPQARAWLKEQARVMALRQGMINA